MIKHLLLNTGFSVNNIFSTNFVTKVWLPMLMYGCLFRLLIVLYNVECSSLLHFCYYFHDYFYSTLSFMKVCLKCGPFTLAEIAQR